MRRIYVAAGEASGDALGAALITVLRERWPGLEARGLAGPKLRALGVRGPVAAESVTALGLAEAVARLPAVHRALRSLTEDAQRFAPEVLVTIDSPGLNLRLARRLPDLRRLQWVAPQLWAWRPGRAPRVAASVDTLCCLLPFEPAWFAGLPVRAVFTGHPAARPWRAARDPEPTLALVPGSRPAEVARLWPVMRVVAARVAAHVPGLRLRVAVAPTLDRGALGGLAVTRCDGVRPAVEGAWAALVCSGTATVEVAAAGVPQVVVYQVSPATWWAGWALVRGVGHLALPNLLAGAEIAPEHLQHLDPEAIAADLVAAMTDRTGQVEQFAPWLAGLRPQGSVARVADEAERLALRRC